jgi:hypothetical protein
MDLPFSPRGARYWMYACAIEFAERKRQQIVQMRSYGDELLPEKDEIAPF